MWDVAKCSFLSVLLCLFTRSIPCHTCPHPAVASATAAPAPAVCIFAFARLCACACSCAGGQHFALYLVVPGPEVKGVALPVEPGVAPNTHLTYRINGLRCGVLSVALAFGAVRLGLVSATFAYDEFLPLATTSVLFALAFSTYLYVASVLARPYGATEPATPATQLARNGNTGSVIYDYWLGRTLNPRLGFLDFKYVCELRPGLVGWMLVNFSFAAQQLKAHGEVRTRP